MKIKRGLLIAMGVLLAIALVIGGCAPAGPDGAPPTETEGEELPAIEFTFASAFAPPGVSLPGDGDLIWQEEVTRRSGGKITFENYYGCALGTPEEHTDLVMAGAVDIAHTYYWYRPSDFPIGNFIYVFPFSTSDPVIVVKARRQIDEEFPCFEEERTRNNVVALAHRASAPFDFMCRQPIEDCEGFEGKKVNLIGRYFGRWVEPLGASAVTGPGHEWYSRLETGATDCGILPQELLDMFKLYEVCPYWIKVGAFATAWSDIMINLDVYNSLPAEYQQILKETGEWIELKEASEIMPEWLEGRYAHWIEEGVIPIEFPQSERDKWASRVEDIPAEWAAEVTALGYPGWELVERWQEITTDLGYDWPRHWGEKPE